MRELERRQQVLGLEAVARKEGEQLLLQRRYVGQQAGGGGAWLGSRLGLGLGLGLGSESGLGLGLGLGLTLLVPVGRRAMRQMALAPPKQCVGRLS